MGSVPAYLIPIGYVHDFCIVWDLCLHVQFPGDMCTISVLYGNCACIFNSQGICAQVMCSDLFDYFWMKDLLGMLEDSLGSIILLISVLVMILTYHEVLMVYGPLGRG